MKALVAALLLAWGLPAAAAPSHWRQDITAPDRKRLAKLWEAWTRALGEAQAAGQGAAVAALGPVVVPDAATINYGDADARPAGPLPVAGQYKCRMINLGQRAGGARAPAAAVVDTGALLPCRIEARGKGLWFQQNAGAQRLGGRLFADGDRQVFLGTTALAGEMAGLPYGADPQRDAVGVLRATAPQRWRLELPWPNWQSNLTIIEISPA